uniref:Putative defense protein 1 n=1 Tax=Antheraea mylitta TaxID=34739 RepID=DFP1_ANTMY|nr:RecName: Full=Putative defense protein 1; Short=DFP-1; Flags: Precursor [Antheraea mylitta]ABG72705.1 putative defense protein [Antheraea mylitta]
MMFAYIVAVVSALALTSAFPTGAPRSACFDMIPGHFANPKLEPAPYTITTPISAVKGGNSVEVTISGKTPEDTMRGILLEARQGDNIVGTWTVPPGDDFSQPMNCGEPNNAVTHKRHSESADKQTVSYVWTAPSDLEGDVVFMVTIVKDYSNFWVRQTSAPVKILSHH